LSEYVCSSVVQQLHAEMNLGVRKQLAGANTAAARKNSGTDG
jgi:hypothetical protein